MNTLVDLNAVYTFIDLAGTFAFAVSGAVAAKDKGLDVFGIAVVAFTIACGGGIIRDLCIGAIPPIGLSDWRYLAVAMGAACMVMGLAPLTKWMKRPVLLFDGLGLSLFAVSGARKALEFDHNYQVAILLGMITAIGGGVLRDVLLNRVPVILEKEIYASAALLGAGIVVLGNYLGWNGDWVFLIGIGACFTLRMLALRYHWELPSFNRTKGRGSVDRDG
jgi:uncharacterized membrane protein YeiH